MKDNSLQTQEFEEQINKKHKQMSKKVRNKPSAKKWKDPEEEGEEEGAEAPKKREEG